ncbi:MAG: ABC transporter substrate-binding protein [Anaerolineae bacterium]|nr:ABC transporter substrate-binding protein [Anaerolineae bacterium]
MKSKLWTCLAVGVVLTMVLTGLLACGPTTEPTKAPEPVKTEEPTQAPEPTAEKKEPVTLRVGTTYIWDTANPTIGWYNYGLRYLIYDTLVEEAGISNFVPGLAESWDVSEDGLVWTFKIRESVKFHDGTACTAEDVAWSLNWTIENEIETFAFYLANFSEIVALDPTTLQVTLSEPVGNMEYLLMYVWILPRSVWEGKTPDEILEFEDLSAGIGTGPYKLVDWVEGEYLILEANQDYWRGAPAIERVIYQEYATEDATVSALLAGEVDVVDDVPRTAIQTLQDAENVEVPIMESTSIDELIINSHENGTQPASLNDPAVRLAIAYAIDKQQIINVAYLGYADAASVIIPRSMGDWHNSDVVDIPYNPTEGSRILQEAGYLDSDGDGVREDKEGNPLEYRLYGSESASNVRILEIISNGLAQVGISAPPTAMDEDSLIGLYPDFDFDMIYWGWGLDPDPDFAMLIFTCDQREEGGWNDSGYCDAEFEEMYQQQAVTVDREARRAIVWQMEEKLFNDRPYIVLTYYKNIQAYRSDRFTGFGLEPGDILWKAAFLTAKPVQ